MGVLGFINHVLNFAAPALALAVVLPVLSRWMPMGRGATTGTATQIVVLAVVNMAVLVAGLLFFGRDGKMVSYLSMAAACATAQFLMVGAWRS